MCLSAIDYDPSFGVGIFETLSEAWFAEHVHMMATWAGLLVYDKEMPIRCLQFVNTGLVKSQTYLQYHDSTGHILIELVP